MSKLSEDIDERSFEVVNKWKNKTKLDKVLYTQQLAMLQCLINEALEEQDMLTRRACAKSTTDLLNKNPHSMLSKTKFDDACMNSKAV